MSSGCSESQAVSSTTEEAAVIVAAADLSSSTTVVGNAFATAFAAVVAESAAAVASLSKMDLKQEQQQCCKRTLNDDDVSTDISGLQNNENGDNKNDENPQQQSDTKRCCRRQPQEVYREQQQQQNNNDKHESSSSHACNNNNGNASENATNTSVGVDGQQPSAVDSLVNNSLNCNNNNNNDDNKKKSNKKHRMDGRTSLRSCKNNNNDKKKQSNPCTICLESLTCTTTTTTTTNRTRQRQPVSRNIGTVSPCGHVFHEDCWAGYQFHYCKSIDGDTWRFGAASDRNVLASLNCCTCKNSAKRFIRIFLDFSGDDTEEEEDGTESKRDVKDNDEKNDDQKRRAKPDAAVSSAACAQEGYDDDQKRKSESVVNNVVIVSNDVNDDVDSLSCKKYKIIAGEDNLTFEHLIRKQLWSLRTSTITKAITTLWTALSLENYTAMMDEEIGMVTGASLLRSSFECIADSSDCTSMPSDIMERTRSVMGLGGHVVLVRVLERHCSTASSFGGGSTSEDGTQSPSGDRRHRRIITIPQQVLECLLCCAFVSNQAVSIVTGSAEAMVNILKYSTSSSLDGSSSSATNVGMTLRALRLLLGCLGDVAGLDDYHKSLFLARLQRSGVVPILIQTMKVYAKELHVQGLCVKLLFQLKSSSSSRYDGCDGDGDDVIVAADNGEKKDEDDDRKDCIPLVIEFLRTLCSTTDTTTTTPEDNPSRPQREKKQGTRTASKSSDDNDSTSSDENEDSDNDNDRQTTEDSKRSLVTMNRCADACELLKTLASSSVSNRIRIVEEGGLNVISALFTKYFSSISSSGGGGSTSLSHRCGRGDNVKTRQLLSLFRGAMAVLHQPLEEEEEKQQEQSSLPTSRNHNRNFFRHYFGRFQSQSSDEDSDHSD